MQLKRLFLKVLAIVTLNELSNIASRHTQKNDACIQTHTQLEYNFWQGAYNLEKKWFTKISKS